jgi:hypothetical protein
MREPINLYNVDRWRDKMEMTEKEEEFYQKIRARLSADQFDNSDLVFEIHPLDDGYRVEYTQGYEDAYFADMSSEVEIDNFVKEYLEEGITVYQRTERGLDLITNIA